MSDKALAKEIARPPMSEKEKADLFLALSKAARDRFNRLSEVAWRLRISVWVAFGAATGFTLGAESWHPSITEVWIGAGLVCIIVIVVVLMWGPFNFRRSTRLVREASYWETKAQDLVGVHLPEYLTERNWIKSGGWADGQAVGHWARNPVYLGSGLVTVLFAAILIAALHSRMQ